MENLFLLPFVEDNENELVICKRPDIAVGAYALQDNKLPHLTEHFGMLQFPNNIWMTNDWLGILELSSQLIHARGRCLCTGLGLGILPLLLVANSKVKEIVVLEKQQEVITLFKRQGFLNSTKLKIINEDCTVFKDNEGFDCLLLDHANEIESILPQIDSIKSNTNSQKSICIPYLWQHLDDNDLFRAINLPIEIWQYRHIYAFLPENILNSFYGKPWQLPKVNWSVPLLVNDQSTYYTSFDQLKVEISEVLKFIHKYRNPEILKTIAQ